MNFLVLIVTAPSVYNEEQWHNFKVIFCLTLLLLELLIINFKEKHLKWVKLVDIVVLFI